MDWRAPRRLCAIPLTLLLLQATGWPPSVIIRVDRDGKSAAERSPMGLLTRSLDKIGAGGTVFAALCCLGFPALLSVVSAVGLGFIVNDAVLMPLLVVFLAVALLGLYLGTLHHHNPWALILGAASVAALFSVFIVPFPFLIYAGIADLVAASVLNVWLRKRQLSSG